MCEDNLYLEKMYKIDLTLIAVIFLTGKNIRILHGYELSWVWIKDSIPMVIVLHQGAVPCDLKRHNFYPHQTPMFDSFYCIPIF